MRLILTVFVSLALGACASQSELAGTWVYEYYELTEKYVLRDNGTYEHTKIYTFHFHDVTETNTGLWFKENKYVCFESQHTKLCYELGYEGEEIYLLFDEFEGIDMKLVKQ